MSRKNKIIAVTASVVVNVLLRQERLLRKIIMSQEELLGQIKAANAKTGKIIGEIKTLKTALDNASVLQVSPEVQAAMNELLGNLQVADDEIPDAEPATEPEPEPVPDPAPEPEPEPTPVPEPETAPAADFTPAPVDPDEGSQPAEETASA